MGRITLVCRLVMRDLRHHPIQALLLLVVITAAMATLTLGLILHNVTSQPYDQTKAATAGPDVVASSVGYTNSPQISAAAYDRFAALAHDPGVIAQVGHTPSPGPCCGHAA